MVLAVLKLRVDVLWGFHLSGTGKGPFGSSLSKHLLGIIFALGSMSLGEKVVLCGAQRKSREGAEDSGPTRPSQRRPCLSHAVRSEQEFTWEKSV